MKYSQLIIHNEFIRFVSAGGLAAIVNFISRIMLSLVFNYITAIVIAYLLGMMTAYFLCRIFVFDSIKNTNLQQVSYFIFVNILAILQTIIISLLLVKLTSSWISDLSVREAFAHFIGICIPVFTSYLGHKYFTFR